MGRIGVSGYLSKLQLLLPVLAHGLVHGVRCIARRAILELVGCEVGSSIGEASRGVCVLMVYAPSMSAVAAVVVSLIVVVLLGVVRMVILMLILWRHVHLHPIAPICLSIHNVLAMMSLVVHAEGMMGRRLRDRGSRGRRCVVTVLYPPTVGRRLISCEVSLMCIVLVVRIVILAGSSLLEPVLPICHRRWRRNLLASLRLHRTLNRM